MPSSKSPYFLRFISINTIIATILGSLLLFMNAPLSGLAYILTFIFIFSSYFFFCWKSWKMSIFDRDFSSLKSGLLLSFSWMFVWDIILFGYILVSYYKQGGVCGGFIYDDIRTCRLWEYAAYDLGAVILLMLMFILFLLPIVFGVTGLYFDKRKRKETLPIALIIVAFGLVIFGFLNTFFLSKYY